jgi:hypothetical protein
MLTLLEPVNAYQGPGPRNASRGVVLNASTSVDCGDGTFAVTNSAKNCRCAAIREPLSLMSVDDSVLLSQIVASTRRCSTSTATVVFYRALRR